MAGDLNLKKSWNPALVKNQTKVWEEEQAKLAELKKIRERNEELEKEQEYINLLRLQHGDDFDKEDLSKTEKLKLNKLNWMYEDVPHASKNEAGFIERNDEFVEGKEKVESMLRGNRSFRKNDTDSINRVVSVGKQKSNAVIEDDPLLKIRSARPNASSRARERSPDRKNDSRGRERDGRDRSHKIGNRESDDHKHRHRYRGDKERSSRSHRERSEKDKQEHRHREESDKSKHAGTKDRSHSKESDSTNNSKVSLLY